MGQAGLRLDKFYCSPAQHNEYNVAMRQKKTSDRYAEVVLEELKGIALQIAQEIVDQRCSKSEADSCLCRESLPWIFAQAIKTMSLDDQQVSDTKSVSASKMQTISYSKIKKACVSKENLSPSKMERGFSIRPELSRSLKYAQIPKCKSSPLDGTEGDDDLVDWPGLVYEFLLQFTVKADLSAICKLVTLDKGKKRLGNFYTPIDLARFTVEKALHELVYAKDGSLKTAAQLLDLKVIDPAMGTGIFLSVTLDYLAHRLLESIEQASEPSEQDGQLSAPDLVSARIKIAQNCLYGVDLDEGAVEIARLSIVLQCGDFSPEFYAGLLSRLKCGNSLIGCQPKTGVTSGSLLDADEWCNEFFGLMNAEQNPFNYFHWHLQFPEIFERLNPGFDAVLGNPPWEIHKPNSREFFQTKDDQYWSLGKQEALGKQNELRSDTSTEAEWLKYQNEYKLFSIWVLKSGLFGLQGSSDINAYKLFVELAYLIAKNGGVVSLIVPSGIYSDKGSIDLRTALLQQSDWKFLYAFHNAEGLFDIHRSFKFCVVTFAKTGVTSKLKAVFDARNVAEAKSSESVTYSIQKLCQISPKWLSVPEAKSSKDLELLEKIAKNSIRLDSFVERFELKFKREFDMTNDSHKFMLRDKAEVDGFHADEHGNWLRGNWIKSDREEHDSNYVRSADGASKISNEDVTDVALPLYEGRMLGQFDIAQKGWIHGKGRRALWLPVPDQRIRPQYLLNAKDYSPEFAGLKIGFLGVGSATNVRSMIAACLGNYPCGNSVPTFSGSNPKIALLFAACLNSFVFDFVLRLRLVGNNLNYFILQECFLPLPDLLLNVPELLDIVIKLSLNNKQFGTQLLRSLNAESHESQVAGVERLRLRCILDALIAELYGLEVGDLNYILRDCDLLHSGIPKRERENQQLNSKGFWRVDKNLPPAGRHTILTLDAFGELKRLGRDKFLSQNDRVGWQLPSDVIEKIERELVLTD